MTRAARPRRTLDLSAGHAWVAGVCLLLCGCATEHPNSMLDPVGPVSGGRAGLLSSGDGYLRVFSATQAHNDGSIVYYPHTPYTVYTPEGKRVKGVQNHVGLADQTPMTVPLPPGRYVVHARAEGWGRVTVPVTIVSTRMTVVYLEGKGLPEAREVPDSELVRLPDGRPIGRRAAVLPAPKAP